MYHPKRVVGPLLKIFFGKNKNVTFFVLLRYKSVQKNRKIERVVSRKMGGRTNEGPNSTYGRGPKMRIKYLPVFA